MEITATNEASDEMDTVETIVKPSPKPFTIESLIGNRAKIIDNKKKNIVDDSDDNYERKNNEFERGREFFYQQHCLATATSALPGMQNFSIVFFISM